MKPEEKVALQTGAIAAGLGGLVALVVDRKSTRLNSSHRT